METPKNIRQIGGIDPNHKIYVEDYVITHTRTLGDELIKDNKEGYAAAVLLGTKDMSGPEVWTYINGMVRIDGFSLSGESTFSSEIWSGIYDKIKSYYEDEEIVGWMFLGCGNIEDNKPRIINIHSSNFNGRNMLYIEYDCEEGKEQIYDYINNSFVRRKGFYVYYQKNITMQNYMLAVKKEKQIEEDEDSVVKDIREVIAKKTEHRESKKYVKSIYAAGMLVAAIALLVGSTAIYNMNNAVTEPEVKTVLSNNNKSDAVSGQAIRKTDMAAMVPSTAKPQETGIPALPTAKAIETAIPSSVDNTYSFYIVKNGDNLSQISENIYNSVKYVDYIMKANNLKNPDKIYEGQKLWIPNP